MGQSYFSIGILPPSAVASAVFCGHDVDDNDAGELVTGVERTSATDESVVELMTLFDLRNAAGGSCFLSTSDRSPA